MSQQTSLKRHISIVLLVIGVICLVSSFYMFYWASRVDWESVTKYQNTVQFDESHFTYHLRSHYDLGPLYYQHIDPFNIDWSISMSPPNDYLTISYDTPINGTVYIVLLNGWGEDDSMLPYTNNSLLYYQASQSISVIPVFAAENWNNTLSTTMILHHFEKPDWGRFAFGIVFASFAVVTVFESRGARLETTSRTEEESEERKT